jgi:F0F1-type ATP synthase membrane subunit a
MVTSLNKTPAQIFALAFGVVYVAIGLISFAITGFDNWVAKETAEKFLIFPVNPLHNFVHIGSGLVWMIASARHESAKRINVLMGIVYAAVTALGLLGILDFLAIPDSGSADNWLHLATAGLSLYFGTAGAAFEFRRTHTAY